VEELVSIRGVDQAKFVFLYNSVHWVRFRFLFSSVPETSSHLPFSCGVFAALLCILLSSNALGIIVAFPNAVWGHNPVHYYEIEDSVGETRVIASPLAAGDHFSMQFDSLEALMRWKLRGGPPVIVTDRPSGPDVGIGTLIFPHELSSREITERVGYFNLHRALSSPDWQGMRSMVDFVVPRGALGMAWMESVESGKSPPLSISAVSDPALFGAAKSNNEEKKEATKLAEILDPEEIAQRLDLASKPEPTILIILGVLAAMLVIAVLRINYQLHK
jgi:hypothetical protein